MAADQETLFECPVPAIGQRAADAGRLVKALPTFLVLGVQTVALVAFAVNLSFTQTQQGKDITDIKAAITSMQSTVVATIGPSAVLTSKVLSLEQQVAALQVRLEAAREELLTLRAKRGVQ